MPWMPPAPDKIWTGDWRAQSEEARRNTQGSTPLASPEVQEESTAPLPPRREPPVRGVRWGRIAAAAVAAVLLIAGGSFAAGLLAGGDGDSRSLPAAPAQAPKKLQPGETRAGAVFESASPAVVSIRNGSSSGTGFLIDRGGSIVTNSHVVGQSDRVQVKFGSDGNTVDGEVRGSDPSSDLAVVELSSADVPSGVRPLALADSRTVDVGDLAIAIGNPFGLDRTATEGIVSGVGREIRAPNGFSIDSVIQTDAPINPGNSGGPLLDASGNVIGVNSQIETGGSGGNVGIGFAVPSNTVRQVVPRLSRGQDIKRAYLGIETSPASTTGQTGAEVQNVVADGPAARAGLRSGDVITRVDGKQIGSPTDVTEAIADNRPGDPVQVEVQRDGSAQTISVTLGTRPTTTTP